jgi:hypothetical protein
MKRRRCSCLLTLSQTCKILILKKNSVLTSLDILTLVFIPERLWSKCWTLVGNVVAAGGFSHGVILEARRSPFHGLIVLI